jgi:hypothetical protein
MQMKIQIPFIDKNFHSSKHRTSSHDKVGKRGVVKFSIGAGYSRFVKEM